MTRKFKKAETSFAEFALQHQIDETLTPWHDVLGASIRDRPDYGFGRDKTTLTPEFLMKMQKVFTEFDQGCFWEGSTLNGEEQVESLTQKVIQYYHGNFPGWDRPFNEIENLIEIIKGHLDGMKPALIILDGSDSQGTLVQVHTVPGFHAVQGHKKIRRSALEEPYLNIHTGLGRVTNREGTIAENARWATCYSPVNALVFATLVGWEWPDVMVYTHYYHSEEDLIFQERDSFTF